MESKHQDLVSRLYDIGAIKFGSFTLKSGIQSPVYFDLRVIVSYPRILELVADVMWSAVSDHVTEFASICGVPYTALPIATVMSVTQGVPMLMRRKEAKSYGTKRVVEGRVEAGSQCLVVEDVVTTGGSVMETSHALKEVGVGVSLAVVLLDREQGGRGNLQQAGIKLKSVLVMSQLVAWLVEEGKVEAAVAEQVMRFIQQNSGLAPPAVASPPAHLMTYSRRAAMATHPVTKRLLALMDEKKTNLAVSADVSTAQELLKLAEAVAPYICLLKTHADIVADFSESTALQLKELAERHHFVVMEDRKFADIGNTVLLQCNQPGYHMTSKWAELVTCHALPGTGVLSALEGVVGGCVLVAQMSCHGNLANEDYAKAAVEMAESHSDSVVGLVCRQRLSALPHVIHMTPGVRLCCEGDALGQRYVSPGTAVGELHTDVVIVGRGVYLSPDAATAAREYRDAAFTAYQERSHS